jgi:NADH-quinone oxidoreductase subunit B
VGVNEGAAVTPAPVALGIPRVGAPVRDFGTGFDLAPKPMKVVLNWGRKYSLWVFNFGLACCAIEFIAASMARHDFIRLGVIPFAPGPRQADLMVVSGTVSDKMAPAVKRLYEQMPEPKYVISFGACANCGGPYWDSYSVTKGIDQVIPVDVYVPGCPPRPEALLQGIIKLQEKIAAEGTGGGPSGSAPRSKPRPLSRPRLVKTRAPKELASAPTVPLAPLAAAAVEAEAPAVATAATVELAPLTRPTTPVTPLAPAPQPAEEAPPAPHPASDPASAPEPLAFDETTGDLPTLGGLSAIPLPEPEALPKVTVPRRHYFRELRRARDHGLSLFDKAARDQEWEYDDES